MASKFPSKGYTLELLDSVQLPCERLGDSDKCPLIWGHGLGPKQPWAMNRRTCESFAILSDALDKGHSGEECSPVDFSLVLYDARGHGDSKGWEPAAQCIQQFHWRSLAIDMLAVASHCRPASSAVRGAFLGGYSMGASSALWAAYLYPTAVRGLVLLSVTTAWEIREARRGKLLAIASDLEASNPPASGVVKGAAYADLPSLEELAKANLRMPTLLACARDDATHPAEVIEQLAGVLPQSTKVIFDTTEELRQAFPNKLREWLNMRISAC